MYSPTDDDVINAHFYCTLDDPFHGDENIIVKKSRHDDTQYCDECKQHRLDNHDGSMTCPSCAELVYITVKEYNPYDYLKKKSVHRYDKYSTCRCTSTC